MTAAHPRVLIVDDSRTIRQLVRYALKHDPTIDVVGEAADAYEARAAIKALDPDVITLDVEMPRMSGTEFLKRIMKLRPMPVVMLSHLTKRGSDVAIEALAAGAVDCLGKPSQAQDLTGGEFSQSLCQSIHTAAMANVGLATTAATQSAAPFHWNGKYVFIGSSTGGVDAIERVLASYPHNCPPTLITQHMPVNFLASFAERLNDRFDMAVSIARDGTKLEQGHVYIAPGGAYHLGVSRSEPAKLMLIEGPLRSGHRPSVDILFESAVPFAAKSVCVMLTGMGKDGAQGMFQMRNAGAVTLGQDQASSVVYGMPRAAFEMGGISAQYDINSMGEAILDNCSKRSEACVRAH